MTTTATQESAGPVLEKLPQPAVKHLRQRQSFLFLSAFVLGGVAILLGQNILGKEALTFSTSSLISFLFGIALAAASTVLSIAAILLARGSEQAMIDRSEASIRLQNEVFVKTTEALARIESSTGVTEKRIEDIISGRAGELSRVIAEGISNDPGTKATANLESRIRESLLAEFSSRAPSSAHKEASRRKTQESQNWYRQFQNNLIVAIGNSGAGSYEKLGDGAFGVDGPDLFDAIVVRGQHRLAVSSLSTRVGVFESHFSGFEEFLVSAAQEIEAGNFSEVLVAFDGEIDPDGKYRRIFDSVILVLKAEVAAKLFLFDGPNGAAIPKVIDHIRQLATPEGQKNIRALPNQE